MDKTRVRKVFTPVIAVGSSDVLVLPQVASATLLLELQADTLSLSDGDPVSTWADQSGNGHDFTQTGSARPTYHTDSNGGYVQPDGVNDWMLGEDFADNLDAFAIFKISKAGIGAGGTKVIVMKMDSFANPPGWGLLDNAIYIESGTLDYIGRYFNSGFDDSIPYILIMEEINRLNVKIYVNGIENTADDDYGTVTSFSTTESITLFTNGQVSFCGDPLYAILIYQITDPDSWAIDREAITTWLAARYGITL